tara:strand:+ start:1360 stop:1587 length:228 start_codon:yes stop_codon:yes gene_type:complete
MRYVKNVPLKKWDLKIKRESGFLMKSKEEIKSALEEEIKHLEDPNTPMNEMAWAHNKGWIEALEWVLGVDYEPNK